MKNFNFNRLERIMFALGFQNWAEAHWMLRTDQVHHPVPELIVVPHGQAARALGFRGQTMPGADHVRAWWPALGEASILQRAVGRVTVCAGVGLEPEMRRLLHSRTLTWGDRALWLEC